jgi:hypothetical protein
VSSTETTTDGSIVPIPRSLAAELAAEPHATPKTPCQLQRSLGHPIRYVYSESWMTDLQTRARHYSNLSIILTPLSAGDCTSVRRMIVEHRSQSFRSTKSGVCLRFHETFGNRAEAFTAAPPNA